jgi:hypothetical protein
MHIPGPSIALPLDRHEPEATHGSVCLCWVDSITSVAPQPTHSTLRAPHSIPSPLSFPPGRCLAFRQLLADALLAAMQLESPLMALLPTAGVSTAAGVLYDPPRHIADVFQLPRPAKMGVGAPVTADPYVVRMLTGGVCVHGQGLCV